MPIKLQVVVVDVVELRPGLFGTVVLHFKIEKRVERNMKAFDPSRYVDLPVGLKMAESIDGIIEERGGKYTAKRRRVHLCRHRKVHTISVLPFKGDMCVRPVTEPAPGKQIEMST